MTDPVVTAWLRRIDDRITQVEQRRPTIAPPVPFQQSVIALSIGEVGANAVPSVRAEAPKSRIILPTAGRWIVVYTLDVRVTAASGGQQYVAYFRDGDARIVLGLDAAIRTTLTMVEAFEASSARTDVWVEHVVTGGGASLEQGVSRVLAWLD